MIRLAIALSITVTLVSAGVTVVGADSEYARSDPASGARIPRSPTAVRVWFTQELFRRAGANTLAVLAPDGHRVDDGQSAIDADDRTLLSVTLLEPLAPGTYRVEWQSLSALDGDTAEGAFEFTVDPTAPEPTTAANAPSSASEGGTSNLAGRGASLAWLAVALPAVLLSVLLFARAGRAPLEGGA